MKAFPELPKTCSPQQAKYLRFRVDSTSVPYVRGWKQRENEPREVRDARKRIERWENQQRKEENAAQRMYVDAREAASKAILFKSPDDALAAVEKYENLCRDTKRS